MTQLCKKQNKRERRQMTKYKKELKQKQLHHEENQNQHTVPQL